jgi:hypothetical protein
MADNPRYIERISSNKTTALFVALALLSYALRAWRVRAGKRDGIATLCLGLFGMFLFYTLNFRTLVILLTPQALKLTFGLFTWTVPLDNIKDCRLDEIPLLLRYGGAGIHFMFVRGAYRASFNLLEYPRVVITFARKVGPVQAISFSTRHPEEVLRLLRESAAGGWVA